MARTKMHLIAERGPTFTEERSVPLRKLRLDPDNVRFKHYHRLLSDAEMEQIIWDEPDTKKLLGAIRRSGGLSELPYVSGDLVVLEGNRRVVCLRKAKEMQAKGKVDPSIPADAFDPVQVQVFLDGVMPVELAVARARWHVSGKKEWDAINQANHLYEMHHEMGLSYDSMRDLLGMGKGSIMQKVKAYEAMTKYMEMTKDTDIKKYSFFEELRKNRRARRWVEQDPANLYLFFLWVKQGKFNLTGAKDVRKLMDVLDDPDARGLFEAEGGDMAKAVFELQAKNPAINSRTFAAIERAIRALRRMPRQEYEAIPANEAQVAMLKELEKEISDAFDHLGVQ